MNAFRSPRVKICGLTTEKDVVAAADAGATYVGFVFFSASPRNITIEQASNVILATPVGVAKVGLFVNPSDRELEATLLQVPLDFLQLHGDETPKRVREIRERFGLPVIKSVGISTQQDVMQISAFEAFADQILCDAKPKPGAAIPGGAGTVFEWRLMAGRNWIRPWLLAGGLTPENVAKAIRESGACQVDVSSGVESKRGVKAPEKIRAFCQSVKMIVADQ